VQLTIAKHFTFMGKPNTFEFNVPLILYPRSAATLSVIALTSTEAFNGGQSSSAFYGFPCVGDGSATHIKCEEAKPFDDKTRVALRPLRM
jgi:hypothetical protein